MRWKLLVLVSLVAAFIACGLWSGLVIAYSALPARSRATNGCYFQAPSSRLPWPCTQVCLYIAIRPRRRKTQATLTAILALLLSLGTYLVASQIFPQRLIIPRTSEVRQAR